MRMHLWIGDDLDTLLVGDAALLREAYFGALILDPDRLADLHARTAAQIGDRWMPVIHQGSQGELRLRRMLAERDSWAELQNVGSEIRRFTAAVTEATASESDQALLTEIGAVVAAGQQVVDIVEDAHRQLEQGRAATLAADWCPALPPTPHPNPIALRRLRGRRHRAAMPLTNLLAHIRDAIRLAEDMQHHLATRIAVVTGEAGFGKTQLAAELAAPSAARTAGLLLYGQRLSRHGTLDDLARTVTIAGQPVASFDALLAAVDAAATRAGSRLPIVIDGLNESETVTTWAPLLRGLHATLERYPSVLVVCTVREAFFDDVVPEEVTEFVELAGFEDLDAAIDRYFTYYKIEPGDAELPRALFDHPLTLKIYCSVANPDREDVVGVERLPTSLTGMFETYLRAAGRRIFELNRDIHSRDVALALDALGLELWSTRARTVLESRVRELFGDTGSWQNTLLAALQHEGIVIRQPGDAAGITVALAYDLLAGHVIATSLLHAKGAAIAELLDSDDTTTLFSGGWDDRHPLAEDIFVGLAGVMPRAGARQQLWQAVQEPLRRAALLRAAELEPDDLDSATVDALADNVEVLRGRGSDLFDRLYVTRAAPRHPLDARFLDRVLRDLPVADRDLRWSEWLRLRRSGLRDDAAALGARWRDNPERSGADRLRARWLMWTLTSTDRALRNAATAALYWFGRHDVDGLFTLALEATAINDAYVGERVLAAAYGVTTAHQLSHTTFGAQLGPYLTGLVDVFTRSDAVNPTFHALTRHYVSGTFEFARRFYPDAVPADAATALVFADGPVVESLSDNDPRREDVRSTIRMDFGNYTLGRLFPDRANYDYEHPGHREATDHVLGVVHALGWRRDRFDDVDSSIARVRNRRDPDRLDRYGKKYGWIGFYIVAGTLAGQGQLSQHLEVDIDPTFPQSPPVAPLQLSTWAPPTPADDLQWLQQGVVTVPDELLTPEHLGEDHGPWILAHAEIDVKDVVTGRNTFGLCNTVLVEQADMQALLKLFESESHPGRDGIEIPAEYYLFAGEIPWHHLFATPEPGETVRDVYNSRLQYRHPELRVEVLAHSFNWESYHSSENQAGGYVPSKLFSEAFDLRGRAGSFDQTEPSGAPAARCLSAPSDFTGDLLYLRADLVRRYAGDRAIVTFCWGERQTQFDWNRRLPESLQTLYGAHENVWRKIKVH
jgi:hypothetical protein